MFNRILLKIRKSDGPSEYDMDVPLPEKYVPIPTVDSRFFYTYRGHGIIAYVNSITYELSEDMEHYEVTLWCNYQLNLGPNVDPDEI